jgi:drug/metabolite transporter (DMT)-like permease
MRVSILRNADASTIGILLGIGAYGCFGAHDASIKWLAAHLPIWEVLFCRSTFIVLAAAAIGRAKLLERAVATPLKAQLAGRGMVTLAAWLCYYTASRSLPLAQMTTLYFSAPVLVTLMAAGLLGERVSATRWTCVGLGFLGVVVASNPFAMRASWPTLLVLIAATLWAYGVIQMRQIATRETSLLQMFVVNAIFMAATAVGSVLTWITPSAQEALLLTAVGVLGAFGQFSLFEAARRAPASIIATVEYTALLWAFILGYVVWGDVPQGTVWIGAALIATAGVLLVTTERRVNAKART